MLVKSLINVISPCRTSISNYTALLAASDGITIDGSKAITKTNNRFATENSIIADVCYAATVAASHFIPVLEIDKQVKNDFLVAPIGVQIMYQITSKTLGCTPVYPVKYFYVFSTDNSVVFAYEGKGKRDTKFRLCSRQSNAKAAHTSKYHIDNFSKMCGLRVKMTFSISAAGTCAPLFITVYGLNEREMPNSKCLLAPLRGMCIGGGGVNIGSNKKGVA